MLWFIVAIPGKRQMDSLNAYEICYVEKISDTRKLHVELYGHETRIYWFKEIKNMSLDKFTKHLRSIIIKYFGWSTCCDCCSRT